MIARMKIRKIAAITVLVLSSFAANNVAPSKSELEAMYDKAFREFDSSNYTEALKDLDAIDARQPDLAESQNLRGVILMREGIYDKAETALQEALRIDPKFWNARLNLAEIPFLQKNWAEARSRFQELLSNNVSELQGEAAQLIQYKILLTYLLEGKENMVDSILAKFELSPDTPAVHYANAAIALQHKNGKEAKGWMVAAEKLVGKTGGTGPRGTRANDTSGTRRQEQGLCAFPFRTGATGFPATRSCDGAQVYRRS